MSMVDTDSDAYFTYDTDEISDKIASEYILLLRNYKRQDGVIMPSLDIMMYISNMIAPRTITIKISRLPIQIKSINVMRDIYSVIMYFDSIVRWDFINMFDLSENTSGFIDYLHSIKLVNCIQFILFKRYYIDHPELESIESIDSMEAFHSITSDDVVVIINIFINITNIMLEYIKKQSDNGKFPGCRAIELYTLLKRLRNFVKYIYDVSSAMNISDNLQLLGYLNDVLSQVDEQY